MTAVALRKKVDDSDACSIFIVISILVLALGLQAETSALWPECLGNFAAGLGGVHSPPNISCTGMKASAGRL